MKASRVLTIAGLLSVASLGLTFLVRWLISNATGQPFTSPQGFSEWSEIVGFVTGVVGVYLVVKQHMLNWPVGIINVLTYAAFFFFVARHYANAGLQIVFFAYAIEGWLRWSRGDKKGNPLVASRCNRSDIVVVVATVLIGTAILVPILSTYGGNYVFLDALTTSISLAAQFLVNRKKLENWWLWIIADLIYVPLYWHRQYYLTAVLYWVFLILAVIGLREWQRTLSKQTSPAT
jgi:nicotinamide mononucleotide transporter